MIKKYRLTTLKLFLLHFYPFWGLYMHNAYKDKSSYRYIIGISTKNAAMYAY